MRNFFAVCLVVVACAAHCGTLVIVNDCGSGPVTFAGALYEQVSGQYTWVSDGNFTVPYQGQISLSFPNSGGAFGVWSAGGYGSIYTFAGGTNISDVGCSDDIGLTNYTFTAKNNFSVGATATFSMNGMVMGTEQLAPGQSYNFSTGMIQGSPPANFTATVTVVPDGTTVSYGPNGTPSLGDGSTVSTVDTVTGNSGGTLTNTVTGTGGGTVSQSGNGFTVSTSTNADVLPPVTNIMYQTPTGQASESTLQAVGEVLHQDNLNTLAGENVINQSVVNGFYVVTNELGQLVTLAYSNLGVENGMYLTLTNLDAFSARAATNSPVITNIVTLNAGSNVVSVMFTNYATESTLDVATNLLGQLVADGNTNASGLLSNQLVSVLGVIMGQTNAVGPMYSALVTSLNTWAPYTVPQIDTPSSVPEQDISLGNGITIPLGTGLPSYPGVRAVIADMIIIIAFLRNWRITYNAMYAAFAATQARTAGTEVLGTNVNLSSALLMAIAIMGFIATIPVLAISFLSGEASLFIGMGNPLSFLQSAPFGFALIDTAVPLVTLVSALLVCVVYEVVVPSLASVVMGIKLFLVGL